MNKKAKEAHGKEMGIHMTEIITLTHILTQRKIHRAEI